MLARCQDYDLRLLKSIFIHKLSPNLNNQTSACPLNIWIDILFFKLLFNSVYYVANFWNFIEEFKLIRSILFIYFIYFFCDVLYKISVFLIENVSLERNESF